MEEKDTVIKASYFGKKIDMTYKQLKQFIKDIIKYILIGIVAIATLYAIIYLTLYVGMNYFGWD